MVRRGSITLTGDKALARKLERLGRQARPIVRDAAKEWAGDVSDDAKRLVPVLSGVLRDAIEQRVKGVTAEVGVWTVIYAFWTELGNSRQEAQPYLLPAFHMHRNVGPYVRRALDERL